MGGGRPKTESPRDGYVVYGLWYSDTGQRAQMRTPHTLYFSTITTCHGRAFRAHPSPLTQYASSSTAAHCPRVWLAHQSAARRGTRRSVGSERST